MCVVDGDTPLEPLKFQTTPNLRTLTWGQRRHLLKLLHSLLVRVFNGEHNDIGIEYEF